MADQASSVNNLSTSSSTSSSNTKRNRESSSSTTSPSSIIFPPSPSSDNDVLIGLNSNVKQHKKRKLSNELAKSTSTSIPILLSNHLNEFIKAGTIILSTYTLALDHFDESYNKDQWQTLTNDLLVAVVEEPEELEDIIMKEPTTLTFLPTPPSSPEKGKQKAYSQDDPDLDSPTSPTSSIESELELEPTQYQIDTSILETILLLQNLFVMTAEVKVLEVGVVFRIYLIPIDYVFNDAGKEKIRSKKRAATSAEISLVLEQVQINEDRWNGVLKEGDEDDEDDSDDNEDDYLISTTPRSLLEIYHSIESPPYDISFVDTLQNVTQATKNRLQFALKNNPIGFKTELYPYQKAAVAKMLTRELAPQKLPDPSYRQFTSIDSKIVYYLSPNGTIVLSPPTFLEPRGGILAEEMGVGKTAICLALVLSTLGELPNLSNTSTTNTTTSTSSSNEIDSSINPVLQTSLSITFPFDKYLQENAKLRPRVPPLLAGWEISMDDKEIALYQKKLEQQQYEDSIRVKPPLPSLSNILINYIKTSANQIRINTNPENVEEINLPPSILETLESTIPYYYLHSTIAQKSSRAGRSKDNPSPPKIIVTSATLIIIPTLLLKQWKGEIVKHCETKGLKILILRDSKQKFPSSPEEYTKFDIILMSVARFSSAAEEKKVGKSVVKEESYLKFVHFKRLIIDEGHTLGNSNSSHMSVLASQLRCEARWAVSGTPSKNLVGKITSNDSGSTPASHLFAEGGDKGDFDRLGNLFSKFLHSPAYPTSRDWSDLYSVTRFKNRDQLQVVLNAAIVRSQPSKVEEFIQLPPLTIQVVRLDLEEAERLTYNCLLALFVANAVTSQRTDQDYFFYPAKDKQRNLDLLTRNLSSGSTFFSSEVFRKDLLDSLHFCKSFFSNEPKHEERRERALTWSKLDREALALVVLKLEDAFKNPEWNWMSSFVNPGMVIENMSNELTKTFNGVGGNQNVSNDSRTLWSLGNLVNLRTITKHLRIEGNAEFKDGEELEEEIITMKVKTVWEENNPKDVGVVQKTNAEKKLEKKRKAMPLKPLPLDSTLLKVKVGVTTSAKVNYIISRVLAEPNEKFLIFCSSSPDLIFAFLSEALDIAGSIKHIIFAGGSKTSSTKDPKEDSKTVPKKGSKKGSKKDSEKKGLSGSDLASKAMKFNSCSASECQVALLSVAYAARGLHLDAATRVIFIEPIWQKDLERQALKRAHRLGQTKPVKAEILIIRDSFEDTLYKRREELAPSELSKTKAPQIDSKLKDVLQSSQYLLPATSTNSTKVIKPVFSTNLFGNSSIRSIIDQEDED